MSPSKIIPEVQVKKLLARLKSEKEKALLILSTNPTKAMPSETRIVLEHTLFSLLLMTGLRLSEALTLRYEDVGIDYITVRREVSKNGKEGFVYFGDKTRKLLDEYIEFRKTRFSWPANNYLFSSKSRLGYLNRSYIFRRFKYWLSVCKISSHFSPHSCRHTFSTQALDAGLSLAFVRDQLRHSNIQVTSIYLSVTKANREKVKNIF